MQLPAAVPNVVVPPHDLSRRRSLLHIACAEGHVEFVKCLLLKKEIPISLQDTDGLSPLHWAASSGRLAVCKLLVSHGADLACLSQEGETPVYFLVSLPPSPELLEVIQLVVEKLPGDLSAPTSRGDTVLHMAVSKGNIDVLHALSAGKPAWNWNVQNKDGDSPLHISAREGNIPICKLLLQLAGSTSLFILNNSNHSPLKVAELAGHPETVAFLNSAAPSGFHPRPDRSESVAHRPTDGTEWKTAIRKGERRSTHLSQKVQPLQTSQELGTSPQRDKKPRKGENTGGILSDPEDDVEPPELVSFGRIFLETGKGFLDYLESAAFSDVTLVCGGREYPVHRMILAHNSDYFDGLFSSGSVPSTRDSRIQLLFDDPYTVFPEMLRFLYGCPLTIKEENSIPLLAIADYYFIPALKKLVSDFLATNIKRENGVEMLRRALKFHAKEMVEKCGHVIARNFCHIYDADYSFLSPAVFLKILSNKYLAIKSEFALYKMVESYVTLHRDELSGAEIEQFMDTVRFRWMSFEELHEVTKNPLVPKRLLVEALMAKVEVYEHPERANAEQPSMRLSKRIPQGIQFEYRSDFDDQGILFWIGSNCRRSPWENPHQRSRVIVTASSIEKGQPQDLLSRTPIELWTKDVPASWFSIDLGPTRAVVPTFYTIRHGANYKADSLRTWDLRGSNDGIKWTLLKRHVNDESLNSNYATYSVPVTSITQAWRHFRVLQTGHNSSNHNFLVLSGFEIYGTLYSSAD